MLNKVKHLLRPACRQLTSSRGSFATLQDDKRENSLSCGPRDSFGEALEECVIDRLIMIFVI